MYLSTPLRSPLIFVSALVTSACAGGLDIGQPSESGSVAAEDGSGGSTSGDDEGSTTAPIDSVPGGDVTSTATSGDPSSSTTGTTGSDSSSSPTDPTTGFDDGSTGALEDQGTGDLDPTDGESAPFDLSGFTVRQTDSFREFTFAEGTIVSPGQSLLVIRGASVPEFETFWGASLAAAVVVEGDGDFPALNGGETFTLVDDAGQIVDGPTPSLTQGGSLERTEPVEDGEWSAASATDVTPGEGYASDGDGQPYIIRMADAPGSGTYGHEFVEIRLR